MKTLTYHVQANEGYCHFKACNIMSQNLYQCKNVSTARSVSVHNMCEGAVTFHENYFQEQTSSRFDFNCAILGFTLTP